MDLDILIEDPRWDAVGLDALARGALSACWKHLEIDEACVEVSVLACNDARIAELNAEFRDKPQPTNVLSWPTFDLGSVTDGQAPLRPEPDPTGMLSLGDIAIAYETCIAEAETMGKPVSAHVTHLLVHGALHLLGYDHVRDLDATLMQGIEIDVLGKLGLDDPYRM